MELQYTFDTGGFAVLAFLFVLYVRKKAYPVAQVIVGIAFGQCFGVVAAMFLLSYGVTLYSTVLAVPILLATVCAIPMLSTFATFPSTHVLPWALFFLVPMIGWHLVCWGLSAAFGGPDSAYGHALVACFCFGSSIVVATSTTFLVLWIRLQKPSNSVMLAGFTTGLILFALLDLAMYFGYAENPVGDAPIGHLLRLFVSMALCLSVWCTPAALLRGQP